VRVDGAGADATWRASDCSAFICRPLLRIFEDKRAAYRNRVGAFVGVRHVIISNEMNVIPPGGISQKEEGDRHSGPEHSHRASGRNGPTTSDEMTRQTRTLTLEYKAQRRRSLRLSRSDLYWRSISVIRAGEYVLDNAAAGPCRTEIHPLGYACLTTNSTNDIGSRTVSHATRSWVLKPT
jgi:hypothetical protein